MYQPATLTDQNMIVIDCPDCKESRSITCAICKDPVCNKHRKKIQGYLPQASVILCLECADAFQHYCWEFVSPRYAIG
jgi:3-methyladenine DNA glycosylase Tag